MSKEDTVIGAISLWIAIIIPLWFLSVLGVSWAVYGVAIMTGIAVVAFSVFFLLIAYSALS